MGPEAWLTFISKHVIEHYLLVIVYTVFVGGLGAMLGTLMFGRGYKERIADQGKQIAHLKTEVGRLGGGGPTVVNVNNYSGDPTVIQGLRDELEANELEFLDLRTLVERLTPTPVPGTSATYVKLPEGARVVIMDDDSIRLALPVSAETHLRIADVVEAELNPGKKDDPC